MGDINEEKFSYIDYWEENYSNGGTSGKGSYGVLAQFKGDVINQFIKGKRIHTVKEALHISFIVCLISSA
ncbi:hypothetical protein [Priestia megaterium]|uniref:hypothetical protein n=1 Tax=Priestia megaterium TaxID=1404 RepID=UPI002DBBBBEB|nr:hypothetical protein [Priestia megaterium]MEC1072088.1 hypothetical protein [Priestia megaterium]